MELKNKRAVVVGLAGSGLAAIRLLAARGAKIAVTDVKTASELASPLASLSGLTVELALGGHPERLFADADLIVVSPGVPKDLPPLAAAVRRGVPVWSELEFAARNITAPLLAVTGTNGKTTTVSLLGAIMIKALGPDAVFVGGNIGTPLAELALGGRPVRAAVVEVSSFQLEFAPSFHPLVAVLLNVTPDHLDRYRDLDEYAETKAKIFANQTGADWAVINGDDPIAVSMASSLKPMVMAISLEKTPAPGMGLNGGVLEYRGPDGVLETLPRSLIRLHGRHNLYNVMAAVCAAKAAGVDWAAIEDAVRGFEGLPHRLQMVREFRGVKYFNDSKGTNAGAVEAAVNGLDERVLLLMGGQAKGCSFRDLAAGIKDRVKKIWAFGECASQLVAEMGAAVPVEPVDNLAQALAAARSAAAPGEAVLLAPGCASFDQFRDYKDRGETFRRLVMEME